MLTETKYKLTLVSCGIVDEITQGYFPESLVNVLGYHNLHEI
jgi:hypothetical protein